MTRKPLAGWKFRLPRRGPRQPALTDAEQEITHAENQMRPEPEPWPEVAGHEIALMSSEALRGVSAPDIAEAADLAAWRAEYADLLSKGPEAVMEHVDATRADFGRELAAGRELDRQEDAAQDRQRQAQAERDLEWFERQAEAGRELEP
jgi:hypothetical protein